MQNLGKAHSLSERAKLIFLRHGQLDLPYQDHNSMPIQIIKELADEKIDPPIKREFNLNSIKELENKVSLASAEEILTSPSKRALSTAQLLKEAIKRKYQTNPEIKIVEGLREVKIDLSGFHEDPNSKGNLIQSLNKYVFRGLASGRNTEKVEDIFIRVKRFFDSLSFFESTRIIVTHDFLLRFIEIYLKTKGVIPKSVSFGDLMKTQRHGYLQGFIVNVRKKAFFSKGLSLGQGVNKSWGWVQYPKLK